MVLHLSLNLYLLLSYIYTYTYTTTTAFTIISASEMFHIIMKMKRYHQLGQFQDAADIMDLVTCIFTGTVITVLNVTVILCTPTVSEFI